MLLSKRSRLSDTNCVDNVSDETWVAEILPCFDLKGLSKLSRTSTFFNNVWQRVKRACHGQIDVKQNAKHHLSFRDSKIYLCCPTIERAMALVQQISKIKSSNTARGFTFRRTKPVKIQLDKGVHEILSNDKVLNVTCSNITFVGEGKDQTTILGGFEVDNQWGVKFEELTIKNQSGDGLCLWGRETNVDVLKCVFKECECVGMDVGDGTVTATQCEFMENSYGVLCQDANTKARLTDCKMHHNRYDGLTAANHAVVDLHGTKTDIHSNQDNGIFAEDCSKVNIHLPSQHNTSHDNVGEDRNQEDGSSIANINADGTFTHELYDY